MRGSGMKPPAPIDGGTRRRGAISQSQFKGWRQRHRQLHFSQHSNMTDDFSSMAEANKHSSRNNPNAVAENVHVTVAVPPSAQEMSVVGPLMGVFEDLIKSSTPQVPPMAASHANISSRPARSKKSRVNDADSGTAPKRRKGKTSSDDQRWSKRFTWPDELHREFVSAIFDVGLKHSSPSAIMEFMLPNPNITSERVKSHLQKYRKNREKSRKEFMISYDNSLQAFKNRSTADGYDDDESDEKGALTCGEAAAFCTHAVSSERGPSSNDSYTSRRSSPVPMNSAGGSALHLPILSAEERDGPIGHSFDCLLGLFQSLNQQLEVSRNGGGKYPYAAQLHSGNQSTVPHPVEQAAVAASSSSMQTSSSFHEVANNIPHSLAESHPHQGHHETSQHHYTGAQSAYYPHKQPRQFHAHGEIPSIPYGSQQPDTDAAASSQTQPAQQTGHVQNTHDNSQFHTATQSHETSKRDSSPPQQSTTSTSKAQQETTIMKAEMRGQRAFQTKMRAMMQNEMNKCGGFDHGTHPGAAAGGNEGHSADHSDAHLHSSNAHDSSHMTHEPDNPFWNIDNDDEIFDFLMES